MEAPIQTIAQDSSMVAQEQSRFLLVSFTHSFSMKLDNNNFLIWKQQVVSAIKGYGLQRFVFFESAIPPRFLLKEDAQAENVNKPLLSGNNKTNCFFHGCSRRSLRKFFRG